MKTPKQVLCSNDTVLRVMADETASRIRLVNSCCVSEILKAKVKKDKSSLKQESPTSETSTTKTEDVRPRTFA